MKRMKVKDLEAFLAGFKNKDASIKIVDVDGAELAVFGICETQGNSLGLETQEEFPDSWFDSHGNEILWNLDWTLEVRRLKDSEKAELLIVDPSTGKEVPYKFRIYDGFAVCDNGLLMKYKKTEDLTQEEIEEIDDYCGAVKDSKCVTPHDVCLKYGDVCILREVMDTTNSHDQALVDAINAAWTRGYDRFRTILVALYDRDLEEIMESDAFSWPEGADTDYVFTELQCNWDAHAENYLMHIADNQDLEVILKFVKI